jgi:hypothetical protein
MGLALLAFWILCHLKGRALKRKDASRIANQRTSTGRPPGGDKGEGSSSHSPGVCRSFDSRQGMSNG